MAQTLVCPGSITVTGTTPTCSTAWIGVDTGQAFDVAQLDKLALADAFAAGFFLTFPVYFLIYCIGKVRQSVSRFF